MKRKSLSILFCIAIVVGIISNVKTTVKAADKAVIKDLKITAECNNEMYAGEATCSVEATGDRLEYLWLYWEPSRNLRYGWDFSFIGNGAWSDKDTITFCPPKSGEYLITCMVRERNKPSTLDVKHVKYSYHPYLKGKCQKPYEGEGGGYLIGSEVYDNNCTVEMLILDCTLYVQGKDAWTYTTGKCNVENNCMWTIWQPQYGYYWTLFRVYDSNDKLVDEFCYGFQNVDDAHKVPEQDNMLPDDYYPESLNYERDEVEVEGVIFDMSQFPKSEVLKGIYGSGAIYPIPTTKIDMNDIEYVISGCDEIELLATLDTGYLWNRECFDRKEQYYVGEWSNLLAYVDSKIEKGTNQYECWFYSGASTGNFDISAYYKGQLIRTCNITVEKPNENLLQWLETVRGIEAQVWTDDMDDEAKLDAISEYIPKNYVYSEGYTCVFGATVLYLAAKDLGLKARYQLMDSSGNYGKGYGYEYYWGGAASRGGTHVGTVITINGEEIMYQSQGR